MFKRTLILLSLVAVYPGHILAAAGTDGAAFLEIPVGAGPAALGSAYTALATDAYAPVWNPAGLGFVAGPELAGQHLSYLESMHHEHASFVLPFKKRHGLGVSVQYFGSGDIAATDPSGASLGDFEAHYGAYALSYGYRLNDKLSLGITGKAVEAKISDASAIAYAADFGTLYRPNDKLQLAATLNHLGSDLQFESQKDSLPVAVHLAAAYKPFKQWMISSEGVFRKNGENDGRLGIAWQPVSLISLRVGYKTDATEELSDLAGLTVGAGLSLFGQEFAYAWVPYGDLGTTQYFSLLWRFGDKQVQRNLIQYQASSQGHPFNSNATPAGTSTDVESMQLMELLAATETPQSAKADPR